MTELLQPTPQGETAARVTPVIRLLAACREQPGAVQTVHRFLLERGFGLTGLEQHQAGWDPATVYLRMELRLPPEVTQEEFDDDFLAAVGRPLDMRWFTAATTPKRCAVLVSRAEHCLVDLLWQHQRGRLGADISLVASNHPDLRELVESFAIPFHHVPVPADDRDGAERHLARILRGRCDFLALARYMRILSASFLADVGVPVINVHHSLLPAFVGAAPYERACRRGVKMIGATAHYVTEELDAGPIIEQEVQRVSHREDGVALRHLGERIESTVLTRAVRWHADDRLLIHDGRVAVF
jgi:formyltetrahydrofolate deformylase